MSGLSPGTRLDRYEILALIGAGGMGEVYQALDTRLNRKVAIKLLPAHFSENVEMKQRFEREAQAIAGLNHPYICTLHDIGRHNDVDFLVMEYIEGETLAQRLESGPMPLREALRAAIAIADALEAAHSKGITHRDIKPANIKLSQDGRVKILDFGLAKAFQGEQATSGLSRSSTMAAPATQEGQILGTPAYMSPEQVRSRPADRQTDVWSFGCVLYEMLTGQSPFRGETLTDTIAKVLEREPDWVALPREVPAKVRQLLRRCLQKNASLRLPNLADVRTELEEALGRRLRIWPAVRVVQPMLHWKWATASLGIILIVVIWILVHKLTTMAPAEQKIATVLLADLKNGTGETVFDETLEAVFTSALEGAPFITVYNPGPRQRIASSVQAGATKIDDAIAQLVAAREGIHFVVGGSILRDGDRYRLSVRTRDFFADKQIAEEEIGGIGKNRVLAATVELAARLRKVLGDQTSEALRMAATANFAAMPLEAVHAYALAIRFRSNGQTDEAIRNYSQAVELDPSFAQANFGLAMLYRMRNQREQATEYFQKAMMVSDRMTEREKYREIGAYYVSRDNEKAIKALSTLVNQYPVDSVGLNNLALAYSFRRDLVKALEIARGVVTIYPRNPLYHFNVSSYAMYAGDFETAEREARTVLEIKPDYSSAYVIVALSALAQGRPTQAQEIYQRLQKFKGNDASLAANGLADLAIYQGRATDAASILEEGVAADLVNQNLRTAANKYLMLAETQLLRGQKAQALASADLAVSQSKNSSVLFGASRVYLLSGQEVKARSSASELAARIEPEAQAYAKLITGAALRTKGTPHEAIPLFVEAQLLVDTWLGHFELGRAYLDAGSFAEAEAEFELCLKRRGEVTALFLDEVPTYRYFPAVYYYLGRARDGLKSPQAADAYNAYLAIKEKGAKDFLIEDARRRNRDN